MLYPHTHSFKYVHGILLIIIKLHVSLQSPINASEYSQFPLLQYNFHYPFCCMVLNILPLISHTALNLGEASLYFWLYLLWNISRVTQVFQYHLWNQKGFWKLWTPPNPGLPLWIYLSEVVCACISLNGLSFGYLFIDKPGTKGSFPNESLNYWPILA